MNEQNSSTGAGHIERIPFWNIKMVLSYEQISNSFVGVDMIQEEWKFPKVYRGNCCGGKLE